MAGGFVVVGVPEPEKLQASRTAPETSIVIGPAGSVSVPF